MKEIQTENLSFYTDIRNIILDARINAVRSIDYEHVRMYWHLGECIFVEEQKGQNRAIYGEYLIKNLAQELKNEFGSGFSYR